MISAQRVARYMRDLDALLTTLTGEQLAEAHELSDVMSKDNHTDAQLVGAIARLRIAAERLRREQAGTN
jgi:hypothetical protein